VHRAITPAVVLSAGGVDIHIARFVFRDPSCGRVSDMKSAAMDGRFLTLAFMDERKIP
jgi:hypothetical protein